LETDVHGDDEAELEKQEFLDMNASPAPNPAPNPAVSLDAGEVALAPHVQEQIGRRLAAVYDEVLRQPIPERFRLLLDRLDEASRTAKGQSPAEETDGE